MTDSKKKSKWGVKPGKKKVKAKPKKKGSTNPTETRLELYVPEDKKALITKVAKLAKKQGLSKSAIVLEALEAFMKRKRV